MTFYRVLGGIGRALITTGVILLLFVAYQLWGTGIHTRAAQNDLEADFGALIDQVQAGADELRSTTSTTLAPGQTGEGYAELYGLDEEALEGVWPPPPGEGAGKINMPAIDSDWFYVEDVDLSYLRDGPGHFPTTSWPGQAGNAAIAGHRTTYGQPFHNIDGLAPGDEIIVTTLQGEFTYEVASRGDLAETMPFGEPAPQDEGSGHFIISPNDTWILDDYGDDRITLMACHPKYSAAQRIVVVGMLTDGPAATTAPSEAADDIGDPAELLDADLLGNDPTARVPTVLWGLAAGAIWFLAWQIGKTWPRAKWPAYVLGLPLFGWVLFGAFTQVERLLPAAY